MPSPRRRLMPSVALAMACRRRRVGGRRLSSRATLSSSAANGAADRTISTASASPRPRVSRYPSRRCSRWLRACTSQARRRSAASTCRPSNGLRPDTTMWSARMAPNSSGNASSDRSNSCAAEQQRRGEAGVVPGRDAAGARAQVVRRQRVDDGQRVRAARRRACRVTAVTRDRRRARSAVDARAIAAARRRCRAARARASDDASAQSSCAHCELECDRDASCAS